MVELLTEDGAHETNKNMSNIDFKFQNSKGISITSQDQPPLGDYLDYRKYLADFYAFKKQQTSRDLRPYNYQMFSAAADIRSPNYLKMIIEGKRNLSDDMVLKFGRALGLTKDQTEEFGILVMMNQTTDPAERSILLKNLVDHRVQQKIKSGAIDQKTWEKIPNWISWIIYAMADQKGISGDIQQIRSLLRNNASTDEIKDALDRLVLAGELEVTDEGLKKTHSLMDAAEDIPVDLVRKLQAQLMYLGLESLYKDTPTEREFGTLTMSLTHSEFEELKFKLRQMRKSIHKDNSIARMKASGERIYQLNIQLFPVTDEVQKVAAKVAAQPNSEAEIPEIEPIEASV
ncbi:MAG: TIGR02147 family protein [Bdellovibrionota bacterium]